MSKKLYYIKGNKERGSEVIKMLEEKGFSNDACKYEGNSSISIYYGSDGYIDIAPIGGDRYSIIIEYGTELHLQNRASRSWEEYVHNYPTKSCQTITLGEADFTSITELEAFLALMKLRLLRKTWIEGWIEKVTDKNYYLSYNIDHKEVEVKTNISNSMHVMSFPTLEMAEDFLKCFKDLLETAKILL